jgi:hypothetical protein
MGEMVDVLVLICENRRMKPVEIVLRSRRWEMKGMIEGINLTKIHCKHIYKKIPQCILLYNYCMLIK